MKANLLLLISCLFSSVMFAQLAFADVNFEDIPQKKIRRYIYEQQASGDVKYLSDLKATCADINDFTDFFHYRKEYKVKLPVAQVWAAYKNANPTDAWTTKRSSCGMMYERKKDKIIYSSDSCKGIDIGQILYMDLRLIKGLYHLATAFEITNVEDDDKTFEVTYTENGVNEGKQLIRMSTDERGWTQITHSSLIRSGNNFRDKVLYPYFHNRLINSFHRKMKRLAKQQAVDYITIA